jgi:hypothetical protein
MGEHIDNRSTTKKKVKEHDMGARRTRVTFKNYLRDLEEELLEDELQSEDDQTDQDE